MSRFMAILAMVCGTIFLSAAGVVAATPTDDATLLREIKEVLWPKAYFTRDTRLLDRILAEDFQSIDGDGNWSSKSDEIQWIRRNKPSYDGFEFRIRRLDVFENGTAIVAGTGMIRGSDETGPYVMEYESSNVFIKRNGAWRAVASHVSGARKR